MIKFTKLKVINIKKKNRTTKIEATNTIVNIK
jgi:hypothetical protein